MVHDMVDFAYYTDEYMGELIPGKAFPRLAKQAKAVLDRLCRDYVVSGGEDEKNMALCAMAEEMYRISGSVGVASATLGAVRVQYKNTTDREILARLYRAAGIYLDIYRGRWVS